MTLYTYYTKTKEFLKSDTSHQIVVKKQVRIVLNQYTNKNVK